MLEGVSRSVRETNGGKDKKEIKKKKGGRGGVWYLAASFLEARRGFLVRPTVFSRFTASSQMCMPRDSSTSTCPRYCRGEIGKECERCCDKRFPVVISAEV